MPSWEELKRKPAAEPAAGEFERVCAEFLTAAGGKRFLEALRARYIEAVPAGIPEDRALVARLAKQQLVRELEAATARGLEAARKASLKRDAAEPKPNS